MATVVGVRAECRDATTLLSELPEPVDFVAGQYFLARVRVDAAPQGWHLRALVRHMVVGARDHEMPTWGYVLNKFRGDAALLERGPAMLHEMTGLQPITEDWNSKRRNVEWATSMFSNGRITRLAHRH